MTKMLTKATVVGARAAWSLNEWHLMEQFTNQLPEDNIDATFMKAVLAVHSENYDKSAKYISATRKQLNRDIAALLTRC